MIIYREVRIKHEYGQCKLVNDSLGEHRQITFNNELHFLKWFGEDDWELVETRPFDTYLFKRIR